MAVKKGWIIFLIAFGVFAFVGVMFILAIIAMLDDTPIVKKNTVLQLTLAGMATEHHPQDAFGRELEGASLQMRDIQKSLEMAKHDERIPGIYLKISFASLGWAKAQEIRQALTDFKQSGKFVTAYMETCNEKSYYLATAAEEIYLQPHAYVELNGVAAEIPFYKRMFNKVGIEPQVDNIGKYKSAGDIYKRDSMSPAHREATDALLTDFYDAFLDRVVEERSISRTALDDALNRGLFGSDELLELNLVDDLKYESDVLNLLKEKVYSHEDSSKIGKLRLRRMAVTRYSDLPPEEVGLDKGSRIALIYAIGTIFPGGSGFDPFFGRRLGSASVISMLRSAAQNQSVKAIVLRVDSPGGSSNASDDIWAAIKQVREKKPVILSMSDVAASGGYWIATACDAVVAQPLTITGSIGVVTTFLDLSGTYDKIGLVWETVKKGKYADVPTDKRPMTADEWQVFERLNREIYQVFVQKTADARDMDWEEVNEVAQGRVWTGERALQYGLIDTLGGLQEALAIAKEKTEIDADEPTRWLVYPQPKGLLESVLEQFNVRMAKALPTHSTELSLLQNLRSEMKSALRQIAIMSRLRNGEVMAIEPYVPEIR
ncbi:signal peptide peptidase SppA [bacterium]|nr:signal peptide peptidase SppA [bacterium]